MSDVADGHIESLVKAGWMAIGLSQTDLAEVLGAAFQQPSKNGNGSNGADAGRLMQTAKALDIPFDFLRSPAVRAEQNETGPSPAQISGSLQSLLELRLLRAFHELLDDRTRHMLVHLAEQLVKRQAGRRGDAG